MLTQKAYSRAFLRWNRNRTGLPAAAAAWVSERKGYGERVGLTFGLILSALGLLIVLAVMGLGGQGIVLSEPSVVAITVGSQQSGAEAQGSGRPSASSTL